MVSQRKLTEWFTVRVVPEKSGNDKEKESETMEIRAYADTQNGCHVCLDCATEQEKRDSWEGKEGSLHPLYLSDLYEYKFADFDLGIAEMPDTPVCDRCREPIPASIYEFENGIPRYMSLKQAEFCLSNLTREDVKIRKVK